MHHAIAPTPLPTLSFEDYLQYSDRTVNRYELVRGLLLPMTPAPWPHSKIAKFLERQFDAEIARLELPWEAVRGDVGQRTERSTARLPDVMVAAQVDLDALGSQSAVLEVPARLVVEIASESSKTDDYVYKLAEYQAQGILEYWIVDYLALGATRWLGPEKVPTISLFRQTEAGYGVHQFRGDEAITSPTFPELSLTAHEIFQAAKT